MGFEKPPRLCIVTDVLVERRAGNGFERGGSFGPFSQWRRARRDGSTGLHENPESLQMIVLAKTGEILESEGA